MFPGFEDQDSNIRAKGFPQMVFTTELLSTNLIEMISQFKDLMKEESKEC